MTEEIRLTEGVMAEEIRVVEHYSASILNKVGEGARVLGALRDAGVKLVAFWGYKHGAGRAQLEFIPEDSATFVAAAKKAKLRVSKSTALYIHGDDRPGAIADILGKLAGARINVAAVQGSMRRRRKLRHNRASSQKPLLAKLRLFWVPRSASRRSRKRITECCRSPKGFYAMCRIEPTIWSATIYLWCCHDF